MKHALVCLVPAQQSTERFLEVEDVRVGADDGGGEGGTAATSRHQENHGFVVARHWFVVVRHWFVVARYWFVVATHWIVVARHLLVVARQPLRSLFGK